MRLCDIICSSKYFVAKYMYELKTSKCKNIDLVEKIINVHKRLTERVYLDVIADHQKKFNEIKPQSISAAADHEKKLKDEKAQSISGQSRFFFNYNDIDRYKVNLTIQVRAALNESQNIERIFLENYTKSINKEKDERELVVISRDTSEFIYDSKEFTMTDMILAASTKSNNVLMSYLRKINTLEYDYNNAAYHYHLPYENFYQPPKEKCEPCCVIL